MRTIRAAFAGGWGQAVAKRPLTTVSRNRRPAPRNFETSSRGVVARQPPSVVGTQKQRSNMLPLNARAAALCQTMLARAEELGIAIHATAEATVIDCGIDAPGGLEAGRLLAEVCLAGLASVSFSPGGPDAVGPHVNVASDHPLPACLRAQYAGWQVQQDKYFAMGSGPMRAAAAKEPLIGELGGREDASIAVGVLESRQLPTAAVCQYLAQSCGVDPAQLTLLVAPTASLAGAVQVVARSLETALHKLHELKFDLSTIVAGYGSAPLPPLGKHDLAALGRTNDAVLYGGDVTLWLRCPDEQLRSLGPQVPSSASRDYGVPFLEIFERAGRDFYKVDPLLFSPARVTFINLKTGNSFRYGKVTPDVLAKSFGTISYD